MVVPSTYVGNANPAFDSIVAQDGSLDVTDGDLDVEDGGLDVRGGTARFTGGNVDLSDNQLEMSWQTTPSQPSENDYRLYIDSSGHLKHIDSGATITRVDHPDAGDLIPIRIASSGGGGDSASSSTYTEIANQGKQACAMSIPSLPNWANEFKVGMAIAVRANTGGTSYVRLHDETNAVDYPNTEITETTLGAWIPHETPIVSLDSSTTDGTNWTVKVKNSNGNETEVSVNRTVTLYAEVA